MVVEKIRRFILVSTIAGSDRIRKLQSARGLANTFDAFLRQRRIK